MIFRLALAAALVVGAPTVAFAQTQREMTATAQRTATAADARLNAAYRRLVARLDGPARKALTRAELKWIAFRDAEADFHAGFHEGGSIQPMIRWGAVERLTDVRTAQLAAAGPGRADATADATLNKLYQELLRDLDAAARKRLQRAELAWIAFRDAEADFQALRFGAPRAAALGALTRQRNQELQAAINAGEER